MRSWRPLVLVLAVVLGLAGCGQDDGGGATPTGLASPPASPDTGASPDPGSPDPDASPTPDEGFTNPVINANFADPFVLEVDGEYWAYATGDLTYNIQVTRSDDLVNWDRRREALPRLPLWQPTSKGLTWAPEVIRTSAGFVMHYTARDVQAGRQCLTVAIADDPAGPFVDESDEPLLCQYDLGGSIDSSPFLDEDGTLYLLWKNDGNCCGIPTRLYIQEMTEDGLGLVGEAADLGLTVDQPWESPLIEAPSLWLHEGTYYLFYSANHYNTRNYAVGYATSDTVMGPYAKASNNPVLATRAAAGGPSGDAAGPGHQTIIEDADGQTWMVYHAWDNALVGDQLGGRRGLWLDELRFEDGQAFVDGPDPGPQAPPAAP